MITFTRYNYSLLDQNSKRTTTNKTNTHTVTHNTYTYAKTHTHMQKQTYNTHTHRQSHTNTCKTQTYCTNKRKRERGWKQKKRLKEGKEKSHRQTDRLTNKQTDKHTYLCTHMQKIMCTHMHTIMCTQEHKNTTHTHTHIYRPLSQWIIHQTLCTDMSHVRVTVIIYQAPLWDCYYYCIPASTCFRLIALCYSLQKQRTTTTSPSFNFTSYICGETELFKPEWGRSILQSW